MHEWAVRGWIWGCVGIFWRYFVHILDVGSVSFSWLCKTFLRGWPKYGRACFSTPICGTCYSISMVCLHTRALAQNDALYCALLPGILCGFFLCLMLWLRAGG
jgi:hypothetical protein